ncbi:hypothetical protein M2651_10805 [Clostridium sp. SYSU_GA19001]|uniref:hypothetical protein n=1 Tax=Clostridium caldaquaticum TaxID=2940653 RepID=UPI0020771E88|nr:hypothetical protein [Clostridium caldaquaticum]MCM8711510.1 hypothetical protein [Clostridium caldaquaticum]
MKKKGSTLVMVIAVISVLLVVSIAGITIATSSIKAHISFDTMDKVNLAARSGIQLGIAKVNKDRTSISPLNAVAFYDNTVTCDVTFSLDDQSYIIVNSHAYLNNKKYEKTLTYNTKLKIISGDDGTIADYFAKNTISTLGNINDTTAAAVIGNGKNCNTYINGNIYLQGNKVVLNGALNITEDITSIAANDVIFQWNNPSSPQNIYIQAGGNVTLQNQLTVYKSTKILSNGDITLSWVTTKLLSGTAQLQAGRDIILQNDLENGASLSLTAARDIKMQSNKNDINSTGPMFMQSGRDIILNKSIRSTAPVTMMSGNNMQFAYYTYNISGQTYLKAGNTIYVPNITVNLGSTYIQSNILNYNRGIIKSNSNPPKIETNVNIFQSSGGLLIPVNIQVPARAPSPPAVAPAPLTAVTTVNGIKQFKTPVVYDTKYDTTYSDVAFIKVKGSDVQALKYALNPPAGTFSNANTLKFILIDGDVNLDWRFDKLVANNTFNNYIIYCTGTFGVSWEEFTFNNSSIISKGLNILSENFTISKISSEVMTQSMKDKINNYLTKYLQ